MMRLFSNSTLFLLLLLTLGCTRNDPSPECLFEQVRKEVNEQTGEEIYWDRCLDEAVVPLSVEEMLHAKLTMQDVTRIALLNNRKLQAVYESLGIASAQLNQAGLLKNPIFSLAYRFSTQSAVTDLIDLGLMQNFLEILLIPMKRKVACSELEATKKMVITRILDVIGEAKKAFYTLQAAEKIWELKKEILLATELSYEASQRLFQAGNLKDLEVALYRSEYQAAQMEAADWEIAVLEARESLHILMGLWGQNIEWKIAPQLPSLPNEEGDYQDIENRAVAKSLDLKAAYDELLAVAANFGIDTTRLVIPQFNVGPSAEREESFWYVGPAFNIALPIFDFGKVNSTKARAKIASVWNEYTALAIWIRSHARQFRFTLLNAFRQSRYLEKVTVPLMEQITDMTLLQHNAMQMGIFDLLSAKKHELEKKVEAIEKQRDYWMAKVQLDVLLQGHVMGHHGYEIPLRRYYEQK